MLKVMGATCRVHDSHDEPECCMQSSIKQAVINITGFSCKDLSTYKGKTQCPKDQVLRSGQGTSGQTFQALLDHLTQSQCKIWIGENVDELSKMSSDNRLFLMSELNARGWVCDLASLAAGDFGCVADRSRTWILALHCERVGISEGEACCAPTYTRGPHHHRYHHRHHRTHEPCPSPPCRFLNSHLPYLSLMS